MTLLELLLGIYAAGGWLFLAAFRRPGRSIWRAIAIAGVVLSIANFVAGGHRAEAVPMTLIACIVAALAYRRSRWKAAPPPRRYKSLAGALRYIAALLVAFVAILDAAFIEIVDPLEVRMPDGLTVHYPNGQSLDENGIVQLDSDWRLEGGVTPDIRVPLTIDTVRAQFKERRDVVLETAVRTILTPSRK